MILCTESVVDQTDHFAGVFVRENFAYGYNVRKFNAILFREIQCKQTDIIMLSRVFTANLVRIW